MDTSVTGLSDFEYMLLRGGQAIIRRIFDFLPAHVLCRLAKVAFVLRHLILFYNEHKMDIDEYLAQWFDDPKGFRKAMVDCDAVVGGLMPLYFLQCASLRPQTMDLFIEYGGLMQLGQFLNMSDFVFLGMKPDSQNFEHVVFTLPIKARMEQIVGPVVHNTNPVIRELKFVRMIHIRNEDHLRLTVKVSVLRIHPIRFIMCYLQNSGLK